MNSRKTYACMLFLLLFFLPYAYMPLASSQENGNVKIDFQPNIMPLVDVYYEDHTFVFSYKQFFIRVAPFVIYNNTFYGMKQIVQFLRNNYPNINYTWLIEKAENAVHYGFNLTRLPQAIADKMDYLGFQLVDLNFPLSWFELEELEFIDDDLGVYNITRIHIPRANLVFSFEDLYTFGYSVEHVNSTYILIGNVNGKTDLILDPITFSINTMTFTGISSAKGVFWDFWNASYMNGWNVSCQTCENATTGIGQVDTQFLFDCKLVIGDGSTPTSATDAEVQVTFNDNIVSANWQKLIEIKAQANLTLGNVVSSDYKRGSKGVSIISLESTVTYTYLIFAFAGNINGQFYACQFTAPYKRHYIRIHLQSNGVPFYNCQFTHNTGLWQFSYIDAYDLDFAEAYYALYRMQGIFQDITVQSCTAVVYSVLGVGFNISNLVANDNTQLCRVDSFTADSYFINAVVDDWDFTWVGTNTAQIYRQYTFDLNVIYENNTDIQNANVTIWNSEGLVNSWLTNSTGQINTQIFTMGFYNQTGVDTIYNYNPYNLTITTGDYRYSTNFTLDHETDWTITLTAGGDLLTPVNISLIFIGCIVVFGVAAIIYERKR